MEHIRFGATGLKVAPFGFGTMTVGDALDEKAAFAVLDRCAERGVNFIDCANTYNAGRAEEILGRWLKERANRDRFVITTKVRYPVGDDPGTAGLSPAVIVRELDRSLHRLQTDHVDIYFLHQPDADTPVDVTWRCLETLVNQGKIRYIGLSNFAAWQTVEAFELAAHRGWTRPTVLQSMYNLIARAVETENWPMARRYDFGTCVYNPLAGGLLTGKHPADGEAQPGSRLAGNQQYRDRYWHPRQREAAARLASLAREHDRSPVELALRFALDAPEVDVVLLGATRVEQLDQCLDAADARPLDDAERDACNEVWSALAGPVPAYHR